VLPLLLFQKNCGQAVNYIISQQSISLDIYDFKWDWVQPELLEFLSLFGPAGRLMWNESPMHQRRLTQRGNIVLLSISKLVTTIWKLHFGTFKYKCFPDSIKVSRIVRASRHLFYERVNAKLWKKQQAKNKD
jgi:hypothetical protein